MLNAALIAALTASTGLLGGTGVCEGTEGGGGSTGRSGRNDTGRGVDEGAPIPPDGAVAAAASLLVASRACFWTSSTALRQRMQPASSFFTRSHLGRWLSSLCPDYENGHFSF